MRHGLTSLLLSGLIWFLVGCASQSNSGEFETLPIPDSTTSVSRGDLRLGAMDLVRVEVFGVESLDGTYQVSFDGHIKMPLIGDVKAVGLTPSELSILLEAEYGDQYLQDPDVSVSIAESVGRRITLDGSVQRPGLYPVTGSITLLQAIALGGGPADGANPRKVVVFRVIDRERRARAFDLVAIRNGNSADPEIYGNDIIVVDGSNVSETYRTVLRSIPLAALFLAF